MTTTRRLIALWLMCGFVLLGCEEMGTDGAPEAETNEDGLVLDEDEAYVPDPETWLEHTTPEPDFTARAADPVFQAKLKAVEDALGGTATESEHVPGLFLISTNNAAAEKNLNDWNDRFYREGIYVFRFETSFGFGGRPDTIGVLPTTDQFEVVRAVGTDGVNYDISNAYIIRYLRELHAEHPIVITGAAFDAIEGRFQRPPDKVMELAESMYAFCPDIVDQGVGDVGALADEIAKGTLFFWWD